MVTILRSLGDRSLRSLFDVERGLVGREVYVNEEIYQMELEQIFGRCWLFLGHESQIPNPGDFVMTRMGEEEVILVRDRRDQRIHAFLNSCRHKGMKVCRYDDGNTLVFTCPFHGWTYDTDGRLCGCCGRIWDIDAVSRTNSILETYKRRDRSICDVAGEIGRERNHC